MNKLFLVLLGLCAALWVAFVVLLFLGELQRPQEEPKPFVEAEPIGPPPSRIEIYLDGQGYWHVNIDGKAVCKCTGGY
jgi:hypothetical protein